MRLPLPLSISGVPVSEKLLFTKHLATMIKAGISISEALEVLSEQKATSHLSNATKKIYHDVQNGSSLAEALGKHPAAFNHFYVNVVRSGEEAGSLEENLEYLGTFLKRDHQLRQKVRSALLYPTMVLIAASGMGMYISLFVLPQLLSFFKALDVSLPLSTQLLLGIAGFMETYGIVFFMSTFVGIVMTFLVLNGPLFRQTWHQVVVKLPLIGKLRLYTQLIRFSRNLALMLKSGLPLPEALATTTKTIDNAYMQSILQKTADQLDKGTHIFTSLSKADQAVFPSLLVKLIGVGERTANLESTLFYLADFYEDELETETKNVTTVLEPLLLMVIAGLVAFLALAIITPIYDVTGSIGR